MEEGTVTFVLSANGEVLGKADLPMGFPAGFGLLSSQCGMNFPSPVSTDYKAPFRFSGGLKRVGITLGEDDRAAIAGLWEAALRKQ
jgi:hypothetical protein